jgi:hypothetical protein
MSKKKIFLYASDIAAYIGQNHYDFVTPFERLWKRCDLESYNRIINLAKNVLTEKQLEIEVIDTKKNILENDLLDKKITQRQYTLAINKLKKKELEIKVTASNLEQKIDNIDLNQQQRLEKVIGKDSIDKMQSSNIETDDKRIEITSILDKLDISHDKKQLLKKESESFINKTHGTLKEDDAISMYEKKFNVKLDTSQKFNMVNISIDSNFEWYICGKVDGLYINEDDNYIVEVKNRTKSFFTTLRDYEKTQIQLYMYMLNMNKAKLVEKYKDKIRITIVYKDQEYQDNIVKYLSIFIKNFESRFINDDDAKTNFVNKTSDDKKIYLKKLYLNDILNEQLKLEFESDKDDEECLIDDLD